jgi:hypothetical protein
MQPLKDSAAESVAESAQGSELEETRVLKETPEDVVIAQQTLNEFMNQLDEIDRAMLSMSMEGYDLAEIAARLGLSYSNRGVRLHRSRERLRNYLKKRNEAANPACKKSGASEVFNAAAAEAAANRSVILDFEVDDVDQERDRLQDIRSPICLGANGSTLGYSVNAVP